MTDLAGKTMMGLYVFVVIAVASLGTYYVSTQNNLRTSTGISSTITSSPASITSPVSTQSTLPFAPYGLQYLSIATSCNSGPSKTGPWNLSPCWGSLDQAAMFNCAEAAATPQGCTQVVRYQGTSNQNYTVTVKYPFYNSTSKVPWENCQVKIWVIAGSPGYEYCVSKNSTSFVIAQPAPPPP